MEGRGSQQTGGSQRIPANYSHADEMMRCFQDMHKTQQAHACKKQLRLHTGKGRSPATAREPLPTKMPKSGSLKEDRRGEGACSQPAHLP